MFLMLRFYLCFIPQTPTEHPLYSGVVPVSGDSEMNNDTGMSVLEAETGLLVSCSELTNLTSCPWLCFRVSWRRLASFMDITPLTV